MVAGSTTQASTVNWVTYVYDRGVENYVPMELIRGAIHCGMNYALYAVSAPPAILQQLHADFSGIPGVLGLFKKNLPRFAIYFNSCSKSLNSLGFFWVFLHNYTKHKLNILMYVHMFNQSLVLMSTLFCYLFRLTAREHKYVVV